MLTFYPEFESISDPDPEIIILLDMSNSMKGKPEEDAKKVTYSYSQHWQSVSFKLKKENAKSDLILHMPELQITEGIKDNSKIIFLFSQRKHVITPH